ncbi:PREDICTED: protein PLANT CADMIUM RESISTANCE 9-like isoform X1 [Camelina sativa]|uniref:Protein PLANT CADMIUM RESISTANCE 9-like isoform X1 n=1 Tax=Camelina sativa TaxID=90675 RepID=A0ABM0Z6H4_CAMSA|nr:PREDICTED: protein PLANT CADMIUM RESISTANCE 9-like isoform X1 [Camelina sativa]
MSEQEGKIEKIVTEAQWTTGLYDCFSEDISTCCFTWFCPCVAFGRIAEILDKGETSQGLAGLMVVAMSHIGCGWYYASLYRAKLRHQYSLPEEPCADGPIHFFCCACALSQEHREIKHRGLDPSLVFFCVLPLQLHKGWQGNINKGLSTPPFVASGMDR